MLNLTAASNLSPSDHTLVATQLSFQLKSPRNEINEDSGSACSTIQTEEEKMMPMTMPHQVPRTNDK